MNAPGKPVTDFGDSLKVEVVYGTQKSSMSLEPTFDPDTGLGTRGDYRAWFFPTAPGNYTFHFKGSIGSQRVDQSFSSGPQTFETVKGTSSAEFPVKNPSTGDLAALAQRQAARIDAAGATVRTAKGSANSARTIGVIGIGLGSLGIVVALVALLARRRAPAVVASMPADASAERG
jgi:hypothetical protein